MIQLRQEYSDKGEITKLDAEIDNLVMDIYGLTEEEKYIVKQFSIEG
ncbi:MAG: hypothetical protein SPK95_07950 [Veillonella caviae]|nr:hypothetical protein [Veillonella caviae]